MYNANKPMQGKYTITHACSLQYAKNHWLGFVVQLFLNASSCAKMTHNKRKKKHHTFYLVRMVNQVMGKKEISQWLFVHD